MSDRTANRDEQTRRLAETMRRQLGADICDRMTDPNVVEIMLNADGVLWEDRLGCGMTRIGEMLPQTAEALIATVASTLRATVTRGSAGSAAAAAGSAPGSAGQPRQQGQHPADQQDDCAGRQNGGRDPNLSVEERAHQAAKDCEAQMIGDIGRSSKQQLDEMLGAPPHVQGNAAISRRMDKLKVGYPDLFDNIVFARSAREEQLRKAA